VGYSYVFLTQKPGLTTFYHCSDDVTVSQRKHFMNYSVHNTVTPTMDRSLWRFKFLLNALKLLYPVFKLS